MSVSIKDKITTATYRKLLIVQTTSSLIALAGNMIDGIIISRYLGEVRMAAYGLCNPMMILMISGAFIFAAGSSALCGGCMGRGNVKEVNRIMNKVLLASLLMALLFNLLFFLFSARVAAFLGAKGDVLPACADYIRTMSFSAYGVILTPVLIGFMQMDRDGKRVLHSSVIFVVCSTLLDLLNVLVLKWDMTGMGLTTAVSYFISVTILFLHFTKKDRFLHLSIRKMSFSGIGRVVKTGLPAATYHLSNFVKVYATNLIVIAVGGVNGMFANTVLHSINPLIMGFITGSGTTTLLLCSVIRGEGNRRSLHHTLKYIFRISICIGLVIAAILLLPTGRLLTDFFCVGDSAGNRESVLHMFRLFGISIPLCMINTVFVNYYQSIKLRKLANIISLMDNVVYLIPSMLFLSGRMGMNGIWLAFAGSELLVLITLFIYVWVRRKRIPRSLHDLMMMPDTFGVDGNSRLNLTVTNKGEVPKICKQVLDFCRERGIEERRAFAAGHCLEELTVMALEANALSASGRPRRKECHVDIYLTFWKGELRLRIRDDGRPIDASILNPEAENEAVDSNLNMKIVYGMAKDVNYSVVLGLNVFSVVL